MRRCKIKALGAAACGFAVLFNLLGGPSMATDAPPLAPGTYRLEMHLGTITRIPLLGSSRSSSVSVSLAEIRPAEAGWVQSHKVCDFRVKEDSTIARLVFPEKFIASLPRPTYSIRIESNGRGWQYLADLGVQHIGYRPNHGDGALPTGPEDPAVYDWDVDDRPGATLKLSIPLLPDAELYVVQRGHSILRGRVVGPGRIEGRIEVPEFNQQVIGAWPAFLKFTPDIAPDPKESWFSMTRVAPETSCESLRRMERPSPGERPPHE